MKKNSLNKEIVQNLIQQIANKFKIEVTEDYIEQVLLIQSDAFKEGIIRKIPVHLPNIGKWVNIDSTNTRLDIIKIKSFINKEEDDDKKIVLNNILTNTLKEKALKTKKVLKESSLIKPNKLSLNDILSLEKSKTANNIINKK